MADTIQPTTETTQTTTLIQNSENKTANDVAAVMNGTYNSDLMNSFKFTGKGAFLGLLGGFVYSVMYSKSKFTYSVLGCFAGGLIGFGFKKLSEKNG